MKIKHKQPIPYRVQRYFYDAEIIKPQFAGPEWIPWWWIEFSDGRKSRWMKSDEIWDDGKFIDSNIESASNSASPIRSIRAFRRRLNEWNEYLPRGIQIRLYNKYDEYDAYTEIK